MKFLKILPFPFFILLISSGFSQTNNKLRFALCPGFNTSKLKIDTIAPKSVSEPQLGFFLNKEYKYAIGVNAGLQISRRGVDYYYGRVHRRNLYLDLQFIPHFTVLNFLKVEFGAQYSYLFTGSLFKMQLSNSTDKYTSHYEALAGLEFFLKNNLSLDFKYTIPLKSAQGSNFQISLNLYINKNTFKRKNKNKTNLFGMKKLPEGYIEDNGIIYPANLSNPPQYGNGQNVLYQYLENNVSILPIDYRDYNDYKANVDKIDSKSNGDWIDFLYELKIDTLGKVTAIDLQGANSMGHGKGYQVGHLSNNIIQTIDSMPTWKPAFLNEKSIETTFYLPLRIKLFMDKIIILESEYLYPFKYRKKRK